jgi:hypothetical protein
MGVAFLKKMIDIHQGWDHRRQWRKIFRWTIGHF